MAVYTTGKPARNKSFWGDIKDIDLHPIYTCPPNCTAELSFLHVVNAGGNNSVKVLWYVAADGYASNFVGGKNLAVAEYITFSPMKIFLSPGDQIRVQATTVGHIDVIGSVTEIFLPVG